VQKKAATEPSSAQVRLVGSITAIALAAASAFVWLGLMTKVSVDLPRALANFDLAFDFAGANQDLITGLVVVGVAGALGALIAPRARASWVRPAFVFTVGFSLAMASVALVVTLARLAIEGDIGFWFIPLDKAVLVLLGSLPVAVVAVLPEALLWILIMHRWTDGSWALPRGMSSA
jgi:hypothetical protein